MGMSWYLGVKPARTTLSEEAMHSIISVGEMECHSGLNAPGWIVLVANE